jgi:hypothetical protein
MLHASHSWLARLARLAIDNAAQKRAHWACNVRARSSIKLLVHLVELTHAKR